MRNPTTLPTMMAMHMAPHALEEALSSKEDLTVTVLFTEINSSDPVSCRYETCSTRSSICMMSALMVMSGIACDALRETVTATIRLPTRIESIRSRSVGSPSATDRSCLTDAPTCAGSAARHTSQWVPLITTRCVLLKIPSMSEKCGTDSESGTLDVTVWVESGMFDGVTCRVAEGTGGGVMVTVRVSRNVLVSDR